MLIASLAVIALFVIFVCTMYFITKKTYSFKFEEKQIKVANAGSCCKIFVNETLIETYHMPQFIRGETFKIKVGEKEISIKCKTNAFGNKFSIQAFDGEQEIYNNGV